MGDVQLEGIPFPNKYQSLCPRSPLVQNFVEQRILPAFFDQARKWDKKAEALSRGFVKLFLEAYDALTDDNFKAVKIVKDNGYKTSIQAAIDAHLLAAIFEYGFLANVKVYNTEMFLRLPQVVLEFITFITIQTSNLPEVFLEFKSEPPLFFNRSWRNLSGLLLRRAIKFPSFYLIREVRMDDIPAIKAMEQADGWVDPYATNAVEQRDRALSSIFKAIEDFQTHYVWKDAGRIICQLTVEN